MLHILITQFQGNTLGKSVFSRLELGLMCSNIERCIFRAPSLGASFYFPLKCITKEKSMGWRFHKSINLGLGFRVNISKSGIGYSWGGPGYRKTWKANGGTRTTYSIPGTGISYVEDSNDSVSSNGKLPRANSMERYNLENSKSYPVVNGKIDALSTPENELFVKKIKSIRLKNFLTWLIGVAIIFAWVCLVNVIPENIWMPILPALCCLICILCYFINSRRFVFVEYDIAKDIQPLIEKRNHALSFLFNSSQIWNIEQYEHVAYSRVNAGAGTNLKRSSVSFKYAKAPKYLKIADDLNVYQLSIGATRYIFLPDKILVVEFLQVGALRYHDIAVSLADTQFIETDSNPSDAIFLYNTWQYVNNNGTPDRRFKNNRQIPVYAYKKIYLKSETGLNLHLMVSSKQNAEIFKTEWDSLDDML